MKIAFFSTKVYDRQFFTAANDAARERGAAVPELHFLEPRLSAESVPLAAGFDAVCCFVNDQLNAEVLRVLHAGGTRLIALRCAGFNQVDLPVAAELGLRVVRVPAYSPYAVAEHAVGMILTLNRKFHKAYNRVREGNFNLEGLLGFDLHGRTVGVVGTGKIGECAARILLGFGCRVLAYDVYPNEACRALGIEYVSFDELLAQSSIITLHCPLLPTTKHLMNRETFAKMQPGAMLINTSRGALVDTRRGDRGTQVGPPGYLGLDVYEEEADLFFRDLSERIIQDDLFTRLLTFNNVLITGIKRFSLATHWSKSPL